MTTAPVILLVRFTRAEALSTNYAAHDDVLRRVSERQGSQRKFRGLQVEDKVTCYAAIGWDSIQAHRTFTADGPQYKALLKSLSACIAQGTSHYADYIEFRDHQAAFGAFEASVTEIAVITLESGQSPQDLEASVEKLEKVLKATRALGRGAVTYGRNAEKPEQYVLVVGWDSVKAHTDAVHEDGAVAAAVDKVGQHGMIEMRHVTMEEFRQ